jgi:hypothetical protein
MGAEDKRGLWIGRKIRTNRRRIRRMRMGKRRREGGKKGR